MNVLAILVGYFSGKAIKDGYKPSTEDRLVAISILVFLILTFIAVVIYGLTSIPIQISLN